MPSIIAKHIFVDSENDVERAAIRSKETMLSKLTFIADVEGEGHPTICSLVFDKSLTEQHLSVKK